MNFFFLVSNPFVKSRLSIPKFQNSGALDKSLSLFQADIVNGSWHVVPANCYEDEYFWIIESQVNNLNSIYFLSTINQANNISKNNLLIDLNDFTDTSPDYRANLQIINIENATSSYQSEYPFRMTEKISTLYSECGVLTTNNARKVGVFLRNIHTRPVELSTPLYLFDNNKNVLLETFQISLNKTCYIDLTRFKESLSTCFIFAKDYLGIPIYLTEYSNGDLSFEHTHPPYESIQGKNKFQLVNKLKDQAYEKIAKEFVCQ